MRTFNEPAPRFAWVFVPGLAENKVEVLADGALFQLSDLGCERSVLTALAWHLVVAWIQPAHVIE